MKTAALLLLSLMLLGTLAWQRLAPTAGQGIIPAAPPQLEKQPPAPLEKNTSPQTTHAAQAMNRALEMSEIASRFTPALTRESIGNWMRAMEPTYRQLFSEWGFGEPQITHALQIIQDRQTQLHEDSMQFLQDRPLAVGDFSKTARDSAHWEQSITRQDSIRLAAEVQLLTLFGSSQRLQEFQQAETTRKQQLLSQTKSRTQKD
ncbi:hypothetical protein EI77_04591 [Prosthecobacter fusiformis]|uniref:Uncharacterized protein n=1 Tax=Prosthecobacter fusiformis TaxID=48464 RepID=A0A4V3FDZ3_9BACT|nr:hypothetical protein [Prosthecobacter fusiformis]TDU63070.1 hypothetical protein EI77_04591 [Prosthecobacter fusiformis]